MEEPITIIKPNVFVVVFSLVILDLIVSVIFGISAGVASIMIGLIVFLSVFLFLFIFIFFRIMSLRNTQYLFYKDRLEYFEGFLNQEKRILQYPKVTDCMFGRSIYDRIFNTGTILLLTAGQQGGGVRLTAVDNPNQLYVLLLKLLKISSDKDVLIREPLLEAKPNLLAGLFLYTFVLLFITIIIGIFVGQGMESFVVGIIAGIVIFLLLLFFRMMTLKSTKYLFYKDRMEYYEGFLDQERRTLPYTKVTDCILHKRVYERIFNVGTISLLTAGQQGIGRLSLFGGVKLALVKNPDQLYGKLMKMLNLKR
mgnify:CR=1 FL=1